MSGVNEWLAASVEDKVQELKKDYGRKTRFHVFFSCQQGLLVSSRNAEMNAGYLPSSLSICSLAWRDWLYPVSSRIPPFTIFFHNCYTRAHLTDRAKP